MELKEIQEKYQAIKAEIAKVIVGQEQVIDGTLIALFSEGHVLIEGAPGLGKTLMVRALSYILKSEFNRIQFTPDLMPADILGTNIYDTKDEVFKFRKGPVFTNILLADEINRSPAKTQSALLEAMQEQKVTISGKTYELPKPFLTLATQNPIENEGTYPLPEAQVDRFMFKLLIDYPNQEEENRILLNYLEGFNAVDLSNYYIQPLFDSKIILDINQASKSIKVEPKIVQYITDIVNKTRNWVGISVGASPRASITLLLSSRTFAALQGRDFVIPDDIKYLALPTLRHRLILEPDAEIEGITTDTIIKQILESVEVPR